MSTTTKKVRARTCTMAEAIEVHRAMHQHNGCFDYVHLDPAEFLRLPLNTRNAWDQLYDWIESKGYLSEPGASALNRVFAGRMFLQSMLDRRRPQIEARRTELQARWPGEKWGRLVMKLLRNEISVSGPRHSLIWSGYIERKILGSDLVVLRGVCRCAGIFGVPPEVARFFGAKG